MRAGGVLREGLGFDRCRWPWSPTWAGDHLGLNYITTVEDLAVLKARHRAERGHRMATPCSTPPTRMWPPWQPLPGQVIFFAPTATTRSWPRTVPKAAAWCYVDATSSPPKARGANPSIPLRDIPLTRNGSHRLSGRKRHGLRRHRLGRGPATRQTIRRGLAGFCQRQRQRPGRFNVMDYRGATIIADYGHNPDAIRALVQTVAPCQASGAAWSSAARGDRRDQDIIEQTRILGAAFDDVVLYQDACQRAARTASAGPAAAGPAGAPRTSYVTGSTASSSP